MWRELRGLTSEPARNLECPERLILQSCGSGIRCCQERSNACQGDYVLLPLTFLITSRGLLYYILLLLNCVEVSPIIGMMFDVVSDVYSKAIMPEF